MKVKYRVVSKVGTYKDKNGEEKARWHDCGVIIESDKGLRMKLDVLPVTCDGWFSLFEPNEEK